MATEQDAARDRVLAARADFDAQLQVLEASGRAAIDIPAKVRRNPGRTAAVVGGLGFLLLRGPQRMIRGTRHAIFGKPAPLPKAMLPEEIEQTLRSMGEDGDKVRGTLERDFALYAKRASQQRLSLRTIVTVAVARPLVLAVSKRVVNALFAPEQGDFSARLAEVRARAEQGLAQIRDAPPSASPAAGGSAPSGGGSVPVGGGSASAGGGSASASLPATPASLPATPASLPAAPASRPAASDTPKPPPAG